MNYYPISGAVIKGDLGSLSYFEGGKTRTRNFPPTRKRGKWWDKREMRETCPVSERKNPKSYYCGKEKEAKRNYKKERLTLQ